MTFSTYCAVPRKSAGEANANKGGWKQPKDAATPTPQERMAKAKRDAELAEQRMLEQADGYGGCSYQVAEHNGFRSSWELAQDPDGGIEGSVTSLDFDGHLSPSMSGDEL